MSENQNDPTQPVRPAGSSEPEKAPAADVDVPAERRGLRERLRGLRRRDGGARRFSPGALVASTLAALVVGGLGGAVVHAALDSAGDRGDRGGHWAEDGHPYRHGPHGSPGSGTPPVPGDRG